jgi:hypothetical protein
MTSEGHTFVIPVMGTGHTADSPIRVASLGISSVISLVDDWLLEELRAHYAAQYGLPYAPIARQAEDGRARRITAYLNLVDDIVERKMEALRALPFGQDNAKARYFRLLPDGSQLKAQHQQLLAMPLGAERERVAQALTERMLPGSIDVNIMVKVDRVNYGRDGAPLDDTHRDAQAALRGYAQSRLRSGLVLSAGINQPLISYMTQFPDFYRGADGQPKKRIIVKVSDFRSARIQGRYLARKGLEVAEYRLESGLNCGGHAFATAGLLMPTILDEFAYKRDELVESTMPDIRSYYAERGWDLPQAALEHRPLFTVQGGLGTHGEAQRLHQAYGADQTGWGTPFLLVPEATCVDETTRGLLARAGAADLWVSDASPLGIPFGNLRGSGSERLRLARIAAGTPGSPCPKGHGVTNIEFTEHAICISSRQYQRLKLAQLDALDLPESEKEKRRALITARSCICDHLGNGARIALGIADEQDAPQAICPGPNLAWFDRTYSLEEMVDHIYGRGPGLVPGDRPHMFAQELVLYVDYYSKLVDSASSTAQERQYLAKYAAQLQEGMSLLETLGQGPAYGEENLASLAPCVAAQRARLAELTARMG